MSVAILYLTVQHSQITLSEQLFSPQKANRQILIGRFLHSGVCAGHINPHCSKHTKSVKKAGKKQQNLY
jgi:hypothetical protein